MVETACGRGCGSSLRDGEHHNPPSCVLAHPLLGYVAARTSRIVLSTSTTLITTNDPVKIAEDYAMLQHLADGRVDLMMAGQHRPVYPWFGKDIRDGIALAVENYALLTAACGARTWSTAGEVPSPLRRSPRPRRRSTACRSFVWHGSIAPGDRRAARTTATGSSQQHLLAKEHTRGCRAVPHPVRALRARRRPGDRRAWRAGVHAAHSKDAIAEFRPYFDNSRCTATGPRWGKPCGKTPLAVAARSRSSTGRWESGSTRRLPAALFNVDGWPPHEAVLAQIDSREKVVRAPQGVRRAPDRRTSRTAHGTSR